MSFRIRKGTKEDLPQVLGLIKELAEYENAPEKVLLTLEMLEEDGFGEKPVYMLIVADNLDSKIIGMALCYFRYSTWRGKTLFLEDIVVTHHARGTGVGTALFEETMRKANKENCQRMSWQVLDWNKPAITFYKKYGATFDGEWLNCDLFKEQLNNF